MTDSDEQRIYRVGISGSYGGLNMGDEAILETIITSLKQSIPVEITVFSRNPEDTLQRYPVQKSVPVRDLTKSEVAPEIRNLDLFILGGGGILYDEEAKIFLREVMIAHELGVPVMVYAVSAGPLTDRSTQGMVREALNRAAVVTVRERGAKRILEQAGVEQEIIVTADPALLLKPQPVDGGMLTEEHMGGKRSLVGMSVREPGPAAPDIDPEFYHSLLANAADFIIDRFEANIVFVPMERGKQDMQHSHAVIAKTLRPQYCSVLREEYTPGQLLDIMRHFDFAVGMRLHFLIFAALQGVPFLGLPYSSKVLNFLKELQMETPPFNLVSAGRLIAHIDHFWDTKERLRNHIKGMIPEMKKRALMNNDIAVRLLKEGLGMKIA
ncbi:MAG TPA: polysaccharide pyruvyl transferase family protein [Deltaproteobacteria bacterium]|jgi:polysaccharide pyruvyl transferase CsaB|nr:polysaccharide pyruvyl transferase family protein [Pseudomonadota bacterium]HNR52337.1 polysaccharide pyruvyl transferase family protein [Deltaproteobacteria bacterium]HRR22373.1 polysaccharide pyruvyl transferase family protein [Desulfomonilia bacterium]HOD69432.1 polysaccharide pyruvyl transferase family protein [Deltaproteobacteria bacterium]HOE71291.1 polysaccharide pyruvyl transferase family protein [Deltaproteobacteria bacterium]